jgi:hypothetical protein
MSNQSSLEKRLELLEREIAQIKLCLATPQVAPATNGDRSPEKTLYDVLAERGILGCFDGPTDLSTNPKHMEGFGESLFPKNSH